MIFELATDFADALAAMPDAHPRRQVLNLLDEAVRRDLLFVAGHRSDYPQALFQSVWNDGRWNADGLTALLEDWLAWKAHATPEFPWIRSRRPPTLPLGTFSGAVVETCAEKGHFTSVAFSPDGRHLATGTSTGRVTLRDMHDHAEMLNLQVGTAPIRCLCFSTDGRYLACSAKTSIQVVEPLVDRQVRSFDTPGSEILALSFAATADELVCIDRSFTLRRWNRISTTLIAQSRIGDGEASAAAFSRDGRRWVAASYRGPVRVGDRQTGELIATWQTFATGTNSVAISADGRICAANGSEPDDDDASRVAVWDLQLQRVVGIYRGHQDVVNAIAFTADGIRVASAGGESGFSYDNRVHLRPVAASYEAEHLEGHSDGVLSVAFSPDGKMPASGSTDGTVRLWRTAGHVTSERRDGRRNEHTKRIHRLQLLATPGRLLTASWDNTLRLWDTAGGKTSACLEGHQERIHCVAVSADGRRIAAASYGYTDNNTVRVWDAGTGEQLLRFHDGARDYTCVALSPDGSKVVLGAIQGRIQGADVDGGRTWTVEGSDWQARHKEWWPCCAAVSADGLSFAFGTHRRPEAEGECPVLLYWKGSSSCRRLTGMKRAGRRLAFSPDAPLLACAGEDGAIYVWSIPSGRLIEIFQAAPIAELEAAADLYFLPQGTSLVQSVGDSVRLFQIDPHGSTTSSGEPVRPGTSGEPARSEEPGHPRSVGRSLNPYELIAARNIETLIRRCGSKEATAWFPVGKEACLALGDTVWALTRDNALHLIDLQIGSG